MNKAFKIIIIACTLIIVLSISSSLIYYYGFFRPGIEKSEIRLQEKKFELEKENQRAEEEEKNIKQQGLAKCLDDAYKEYSRRLLANYQVYADLWDAECKRLNLPANSPLPNDSAERIRKELDDGYERITKDYESKKNDCFKLWQD